MEDIHPATRQPLARAWPSLLDANGSVNCGGAVGRRIASRRLKTISSWAQCWRRWPSPRSSPEPAGLALHGTEINSGALFLQRYTTLGWKALARMASKPGGQERGKRGLASPRERSDAHGGGTSGAARDASTGERDAASGTALLLALAAAWVMPTSAAATDGLAGGRQHDAERQRRGAQAAAGAQLRHHHPRRRCHR